MAELHFRSFFWIAKSQLSYSIEFYFYIILFIQFYFNLARDCCSTISLLHLSAGIVSLACV